VRRSLIGDVVSDKMEKTIVLKISRRIQHSIFKRVVKRMTKLKAHDEKNECKVGDRVLVMESRPLSKDKNWKVIKVLEKAKTLED
jgi:small subunit ribosomal protein S17